MLSISKSRRARSVNSFGSSSEDEHIYNFLDAEDEHMTQLEDKRERSPLLPFEERMDKPWFHLNKSSCLRCICVWIFALVVYSIVIGTVILMVQSPVNLPQPLPESEAGLSKFSADRTYECLDWLSNSLGSRPVGSPSCQAAAMGLAERISQINDTIPSDSSLGIALELQNASGSWSLSGESFQYNNIINVLVRIYDTKTGFKNSALLVSAHYDSVFTGPGASDDGLSICTILEIVQVLSQKSGFSGGDIVFNFNGAEETGLQGAHAFITQHPWSKDVKAFVNMDNMGNAWAEILFNTCFDSDWMVDLYAKSSPFPVGTIVSKDIFDSGIIPSNTDFYIYKNFGKIPGLDFAFAVNSYFYHTKMDTLSKISEKSMQHVGINILNLIESLAMSPELSKENSTEEKSTVYYDILGVTMVTLPYIGQLVLNVFIIVVMFAYPLVKIIPAILRRSKRLREKRFYRGAETLRKSVLYPILIVMLRIMISFVGVIFSLILCILFSSLGMGQLLRLFGAEMCWFSSKSLVTPFFLFGAPALLGIHLGQVIYRFLSKKLRDRFIRLQSTSYHGTDAEFIEEKFMNRFDRQLQNDTLISVTIFWFILQIVSTSAGIGASYVSFWWCACISLVYITKKIYKSIYPRLSRNAQRRDIWWVYFLVSTVFPALITVELMYTFTLVEAATLERTFVPGSVFTTDVLLGFLIGFGVFVNFLTFLPWIHKAKNYGKVAAILALVTIIALAASAPQFPYSASTPKKMFLSHNFDSSGSQTATITSFDSYPLSKTVPHFNIPASSSWNCNRTVCEWHPTSHLNFSAPQLTLLNSTYSEAENVRSMNMLVTHEGTINSEVKFTIESGSLVSWNYGELMSSEKNENGMETFYFKHISGYLESWELYLQVKGNQTVDFTVNAAYLYFNATSVIEEIADSLPDWVVVDSWDSFIFINQNKNFNL